MLLIICYLAGVVAMALFLGFICRLFDIGQDANGTMVCVVMAIAWPVSLFFFAVAIVFELARMAHKKK